MFDNDINKIINTFNRALERAGKVNTGQYVDYDEPNNVIYTTFRQYMSPKFDEILVQIMDAIRFGRPAYSDKIPIFTHTEIYKIEKILNDMDFNLSNITTSYEKAPLIIALMIKYFRLVVLE